MTFCRDCGEELLTANEEFDGLCSECMSDIYGDGDYDEDDEADDRLGTERDDW